MLMTPEQKAAKREERRLAQEVAAENSVAASVLRHRAELLMAGAKRNAVEGKMNGHNDKTRHAELLIRIANRLNPPTRSPWYGATQTSTAHAQD